MSLLIVLTEEGEYYEDKNLEIIFYSIITLEILICTGHDLSDTRIAI